MLVPHNLDQVIVKITNPQKPLKLSDALREIDVSPLDFFQYLDKYPEEKGRFERARQIAIELEIDNFDSDIASIRSSIDYDKVQLRIQTTKWRAEKLIPKVYGPRLDVNHNVTIDVTKVLEEARARVYVESKVVEDVIEIEGVQRLRESDII